MFNPLTLPPKLVVRALDDLNALAEVARRLPELERRMDGIVERFDGHLVGLREEMSPIAELPELRGDIHRLDSGMGGRLDGLAEEMKPIGEMPNLRTDIQELGQGLGGKLEDVKAAVDDLEPLLEKVGEEIRGLRSEIGPVGDVVDNLPKFMKN
jgi:hypothetical protein